MLYALDHYHANMSNFPGRLSTISQVSENGSSTPLVPNLTSGFYSLERKKQLHRGSTVILLQRRSRRGNALPVTDAPRAVSRLSKNHEAMATGDTVSLRERSSCEGAWAGKRGYGQSPPEFHHALLLTTLVFWSMLEELKSEGPDNTHMTTSSKGLCLSL